MNRSRSCSRARSAHSSSRRDSSRSCDSDVLVGAEMRDRQAAGSPRRDPLDRVVPRIEVDVGRRRGRDRQRLVADPDAADVSDVRRRVVQIADVVRRVPGCVGDLERAVQRPARRLRALAGSARAPARHGSPTAGPCHPRKDAVRCPAGRSDRAGAEPRARGRRPRAPATARPAPRSRRRGRDGCGSAAARAVGGRRAPRATYPHTRLGPGSTSTPSSSKQPITRSRPRCLTSISRTGAAPRPRPPAPREPPAASRWSPRSRRGPRARRRLVGPVVELLALPFVERRLLAVRRLGLGGVLGRRRKALGGGIREREQLRRELAGVLHDPARVPPRSGRSPNRGR